MISYIITYKCLPTIKSERTNKDKHLLDLSPVIVPLFKLEFWIASLLYMVLIFCLSSYPLPIKIPSFSFFGKLIHVLQYGILSAFIYLALRKSNLTRYQLLCLVFAISFLFGISDEIHPHFVPGRKADLFDVMANGIRALSYTAALSLRPRWQDKR